MSYQDVSAGLNWPSQENLDVGSAGDHAMLIERFSGRVDEIYQKEALAPGMWSMIPLIGTDTLSNAAMGQPTLSKVVAGVEPTPGEIEVGKMIVQVRQPIIAKIITGMLAEVQDHLSIGSRTPMNFAKKIAKHEDILLLLQCIKASLYEHTTIEPTQIAVSGKGTAGILAQGSTVTLATANDEKDADKLEIAITTMHQALSELDLDPMADGYAFMRPEQYFTLLKSDKLINSDYSAGNGDFANAMVSKVSGLPIRMTNRILNTADTFSSNRTADSIAKLYAVSGDTHYETSATEAKCKVIYATSDTIMVAQAIPLTNEVFWDQKTLSWYIQSYEAIGAAPNRTDMCGAVFAA